jgi:predicted metal-dependent hydrolase
MTASVPEIRRMDFDFGDDIPRWWFAGDRELTRSADAMHLLFPEGERFFIRSVKHYLRDIDDPQLKARVKGFIGQEVMHGREHEAAFALLERDGVEFRSFLDGTVAAHFRRLEARLSPLDRLAATCALEHLTATLGANAFDDPLIPRAHPTMRALMQWHAVEEVEHKSVAFDVYRAVGGGYLRRVVAMVAAFSFFMVLWQRGTRHLLEGDGGCSRADIRGLRRRVRAAGGDIVPLIRRAAVAYLRPGFHPDDVDHSAVLAQWRGERAAA